MHKRWGKEELSTLQELIGTDEVDAVIEQFRKISKKNQWCDRSYNAILIKIKRSRISRKPIYGGWNCSTLAETLGCNRDRIHNWVERGLLKSTRKDGKRHHRITQKDFIDFATTYPKLLRDIDVENLKYLIPEAAIAAIQLLPIRARGIRLTVKSLRTNKIYRSLRQAEKSEFISRSAIVRRIKNNTEFRIVQKK
jgi:hypothetical protein